jgi:hypothetical protein
MKLYYFRRPERPINHRPENVMKYIFSLVMGENVSIRSASELLRFPNIIIQIFVEAVRLKQKVHQFLGVLKGNACLTD